MTRWWNRKRFDLVEVALATAVIALIWFVTRPPATVDEAAALRQKYGPGHFSNSAEEWIIRDFFNDRRGGFFVDVGAGQYASNSNTYYIERMLGWSGFAIDALADLKPDYDAHRSRSRFFAVFISDVSGDTTKMYTHGGAYSGTTSSAKEWVERFGDNPAELTVPTITLNDLLEREKVERIDFLSMDIELSEPKALAGFDIDRYRPALVCIEAHPEVRQAILDYFARHDYVVLGKYLRVDETNLYFTPLAR